jgi:hypothetical protein
MCDTKSIAINVGLSEARWGFYDPTVSANDENARSNAVVKEEDGVPSAVFCGRVSLACQPTEAGIVRSGYCAVRGTVPRDQLLHGYEGITMRIKTDGREYGMRWGCICCDCLQFPGLRYRLNAQMDGWNPLNLYMVSKPEKQFIAHSLDYVVLTWYYVVGIYSHPSKRMGRCGGGCAHTSDDDNVKR